jgi:hypothetical protein
MLFEKTNITGIFGFENRKRIFEGVDTRFKFVVLAFEKGGTTNSFPAAFMRQDVSELATFPEQAEISIPVPLIEKLAPTSLSIPEFRTQQDVRIAIKASQHPQFFNDAGGWQFEIYGEEIHMNRGAGYFKKTRTKNPLYEGGMIWQFDANYAPAKHWIDESELRTEFLEKRRKRCGLQTVPDGLKLDYECIRVAIRKIASNTNERTLIVAMIPPSSIAGNSLSVHFPFCHDARRFNELRYTYFELLVITALLNSFVVDHLLRGRMTTNLNSFYLYQLPVPRLTDKDAAFRPLVERAARLVGTSAAYDELMKEVFGKRATHATHGLTDPAARQTARAEIDALVAQLYDLTEDEFTHILSTFPLVDESVKSETRNTYRDLLRLGKLPDSAS